MSQKRKSFKVITKRYKGFSLEPSVVGGKEKMPRDQTELLNNVFFEKEERENENRTFSSLG